MNRNLPSFVVIAPARPLRRRPDLGLRLPARLPPGDARRPRPRADRRHRTAGSAPRQLQELELALLAGAQPRPTWPGRADDPALAARIRSFETAFGMQREAPEAFDLSQRDRRDARALRPGARAAPTGFAWQCLVARRLAERGVRFVELIDTGSSNNWDAHGDMADPRPAGQERRPADRRPAHGPEIARACSTTRWSSGPPSSAAPRTTSTPNATGPRAPPLGLLVLAGRRRRRRAGSSTARPTSTASTSPRTGPRPRLPRHDPAPAGPRPRAADLPPRRPRLSA